MEPLELFVIVYVLIVLEVDIHHSLRGGLEKILKRGCSHKRGYFFKRGAGKVKVNFS